MAEPAPGIQVAQGYDFGDFVFVRTNDGVVAIDAGSAPRRVRSALADAGLTATSAWATGRRTGKGLTLSITTGPDTEVRSHHR